MLAVDTNVVVRLLTGDDPRQGRRAVELFRREQVFLPKTVLLETEWVLRSLYGFAPTAIFDALEALIALPNVTCESLGAIAQSIGWARKGLDLADALHVASSAAAEGFATFDDKLIRRAGPLAPLALVKP